MAKGVSIGRLAVAGLAGIVGSFFISTPYYLSLTAQLVSSVLSATYSGIEALVVHSSGGETRARDAVGTFLSHYAGRTIGHLARYPPILPI